MDICVEQQVVYTRDEASPPQSCIYNEKETLQTSPLVTIPCALRVFSIGLFKDPIRYMHLHPARHPVFAFPPLKRTGVVTLLVR